MDVTELDLQNLYTWIDDIPLSRPKRNFTRDFADGVLLAEILHYYFPRFVQMHNYSSANSLRQKQYNWDTLNRKVLSRLGIEVSKEELDNIANSQPRAIERLLKHARIQILEHKSLRHDDSSGGRVKTPECTYHLLYEQGEDANNSLDLSRGRPFGKLHMSPDESLRQNRISQIPRAPSQMSATPPPKEQASRRPKSSFEVCSSLEKDLIIKELQETNELLLAKISKLEQLLRLKDKKIDSLSAKLHIPSNYSNNYSGSMTP